MLIWINGAFGAGKTQTAHELRRRLGAGHMADPELLGSAIHRMLPPGPHGDFQDRPQWRTGILETLRQAVDACDGPVIVPMTLVRDDYFDEVVGGLRSSGVDVRHYALTAAPDVLRSRLRRRPRAALRRTETWAFQQVDRCTSVLARPRYAHHVPTDDRTLDQVVETIADDLGLPLARPRLPPARSRIRRLAVAALPLRP